MKRTMTQTNETPCFHGGAFWDALGGDFRTLAHREHVVSADVLDAWFAPAPAVIDALREHAAFLCQTSPPTHADGLVRTIAEVRGLPEQSVLVGAGSSALLFLAAAQWLSPSSRVLLPTPTYGEYAHVLDTVIKCHVDRFSLPCESNYDMDLDRWAQTLAGGAYDFAVLVNPNNPTGRHIPCAELECALARIPPRTRVWIDEAYADYVGESVEGFAAHSANVVVCKSLSKGLALSGLRAAYLCAAPAILDTLRPFVPPWAVSLPAQVAAVLALHEANYYAARYAETHQSRAQLAQNLRRLPLKITESVANWLLCKLPEHGPTAADVVQACRADGVYLRDGTAFGPAMGTRTVRVAVKAAEENARIVAALARALNSYLPA